MSSPQNALNNRSIGGAVYKPIRPKRKSSANHSASAKVQPVAQKVIQRPAKEVEKVGFSVRQKSASGNQVGKVSFKAMRRPRRGGQDPIDGKMKFVVEKALPQLKVQVEKVASTPVVLCNQYNKKDVRNLDTDSDQQIKLQDIYGQLKQAIAPPGSTDFIVYISHHEVSYKHNGVPVVKKLQPFLDANPALAKNYETTKELIRKDIWKGSLHSASSRSKKPGQTNGLTPFVRTNDALKGLPANSGPDAYEFALKLSDSTGMSQADKDAALKRLGAAEKMIKHLKDKIDAEAALLEQQVGANPPPPNSDQLELELRRLRKKKAQLAHLDYAALYSALTFFPNNPTAETASTQAQALSRAMSQEIVNRTEEIKKGARLWIPDLPGLKNLRKDVDLEPNKSWPLDAGALVFSGLSDLDSAERKYGEYCNDNGIFMKDEKMEHAIMRAVISPATANPALQNLFADVADNNIKQRLDQELVTAGTQAQAVLNNATALTATEQRLRIDQFRGNVGL